MIRKVKFIDRLDGTRLVLDQRNGKPVVMYRGPRDKMPAELEQFVPAKLRDAAATRGESVRQLRANSRKRPSQRGRLWRWLAAQTKRLLLAKLNRMPQAAIDARYAICAECPHKRSDKSGKESCGKCGCGVSREQKLLTNKLAVATSACPDKPPRWGVYEPGVRRWAVRLAKWLG